MFDMVLTTDQVAQRLNFTSRHVRILFQTGVIGGFKRGVRSWGIYLADFERWLSSRGNRPKAGK